jgi:hypothetical protein
MLTATLRLRLPCLSFVAVIMTLIASLSRTASINDSLFGNQLERINFRSWPVSVRATDRPAALDVRLFGHFKSVVDLDSKVAHGVFQFDVPEQ